ncbi:MAG: hypothetical protein J6A83_08095 [Clostridia bacterium]|nr:hypothetical protein [Clostridia bacterium]
MLNTEKSNEKSIESKWTYYEDFIRLVNIFNEYALENGGSVEVNTDYALGLGRISATMDSFSVLSVYGILARLIERKTVLIFKCEPVEKNRIRVIFSMSFEDLNKAFG